MVPALLELPFYMSRGFRLHRLDADETWYFHQGAPLKCTSVF